MPILVPYSWALPRLDNLPANPCIGAGRPPKPKPRDRVLSPAELASLWCAVEAEDDPWRSAIKLLILTGQRRSEVFGARRSEFDLKASMWIIPADRAKNGVQHLVPLSRSAASIIIDLPKTDASRWLFPAEGNLANNVSGIPKVVDRLRKAVSNDFEEVVPRWTLHDIRRTVVTGFQKLGVRFEVTEAVLNHISGSRGGIAGIYQRHDWATEKREALDAWADWVATCVEELS